MKLAIFTLFLVLLLASPIQAKTITEKLEIGQSVELRNQNITLINIDEKGDSVLLCVNGEKGIVSEDRDKIINSVTVSVKYVKENSAKIEFQSSCNDCELNDNTVCFDECSSDSECEDNNEATIDLCIGKPKKCVNEEPIPEPPKEENTTITPPPEEEPPKSQETYLSPITKFLDWLFNLF